MYLAAYDILCFNLTKTSHQLAVHVFPATIWIFWFFCLGRLTDDSSLVLPYPESCSVVPEEHVKCPMCGVRPFICCMGIVNYSSDISYACTWLDMRTWCMLFSPCMVLSFQHSYLFFKADYCSSACQKKALEKYHETLCTREPSTNESHPINKLKEAWRFVSVC